MPHLSQNFDADFSAITAGLRRDYAGPPYAFARYADGEAGVAFGSGHIAQSDGWVWKPGKRNLLSDQLLDSLAYVDDGWHVGVTAESHHPQEHGELLRYVGVPPERITFAELFIFANYRRWLDLDTSHCLTVGPPPRSDYPIPPFGIESGWLWHSLADQLIEEASGPILVAAGPLAKVLIYEYWRRSSICPERRQVILDVGSALRLSNRYIRKKVGRRRIRLRESSSRITRRYQRWEDPAWDYRPNWKCPAGGCPADGFGAAAAPPDVAGGGETTAGDSDGHSGV